MDAWGIGPFENEYALDWYDQEGVSLCVQMAVNNALAEDAGDRSYPRWYAAAAMIAMFSHDTVLWGWSPQAFRRLQQIISDRHYVSGWDNPSEYVRRVKALQDALR